MPDKFKHILNKLIQSIITIGLYAARKSSGYIYSIKKSMRYIKEFKNLSDLDKKIFLIQQGTKTSFKIFTKPHDKLRSKYKWYYAWHSHSHHKKTHFATLALVLTLCFTLVYNGYPHSVKAAESFRAKYNNETLDADSGSDTTAYNDGTPASLVDGYGGFGQAAQVGIGQSLAYKTAGNLSGDSGQISMKFKIPYSTSGADDSVGKFGEIVDCYYDSNSGYFYIADRGLARIVKTKFDGSGWQTLGGWGNDNKIGNFSYMESIFYDAASDYIYIAESSRIIKTKIDGSGWTNYYSTGQAADISGSYHRATNLYFDHDSQYLYFIRNNSEIVKTKLDGQWTGWTKYITPGYGVGQAPFGVSSFSYDAGTGYFYMGGDSNIIKTKLDGQWTGWQRYFGIGDQEIGYVNDIFYNPFDHLVYFVNNYEHRLTATDLNTFHQSESASTRNDQLHIAGSDDSGNIYGSFGYSLVKIRSLNEVSSYGQQTATNYYASEGNIGGDQFRNLSDIMLKDGKILFASPDTEVIGEATPDKGAVRFYGIDAGIKWGAGISSIVYTQSNFYYYIGGYEWDRSLYKAKFDGSGAERIYSNGQGININNPVGLHYDETSGNLFILEKGSDPSRIIQIDSDGNWTEFDGRKNGGGDQLSGGTNGCMSYDPATNLLYICDSNFFDNRIVRTKIDGSGWQTFSVGDANYGMSRVSDIIIDNGYMYIAEENRIIKTDWNASDPDWSELQLPDIEINKIQSMAYDYASGFFYIVQGDRNAMMKSRIIKTKFDGSDMQFINGNSIRTLLSSVDSSGHPYISGLRLDLDYQTSRIKFYPGAGYTAYTLQTEPLSLSADDWHSLNVIYNRYTGNIQIWVDGQKSAEADYASWQHVGLGEYFTVGHMATRSFGGAFTAAQAYNLEAPIDDLILSTGIDEDAPLLPTNIVAKNQSDGSVTLTNNSWNHYPHPYLSWDASVDIAPEGETPSGTDGYYLYFGTSNTADPESTSGIIDVSGSAVHYQADTNTTIAGALTDGQTYYFRVKVKDRAGNKSAAQTLFTYKYDATAPNNPTTINVSPSGYTQQTNFTFSWPAATDPGAAATGSGIAGYQYKLGTSEWSNTLTGTQIALSGAPYQEDQNIFYLRTLDNAGNISSPIPANFYYSENPPQVDKITITPSTTAEAPSSENNFSIKWSMPEGATRPIKQYHYVVNPPNAKISRVNSQKTTGTSLEAGPYATAQGENIFYIVAEDEAGNADFDNPKTASFYAQTAAPGPPISVEAIDGSNRDWQLYKVFITWGEPIDKGAGFWGYEIFRSANGETYTSAGTTTSTTFADTGLESKKYYYKIRSKDNAGQYSADSTIATITPTGKFTNPPKLKKDTLKVDAKAYSAIITWETEDADPKIVHTSYGIVKYGRNKNNLSGNEDGSYPSEFDYKDNHSLRIAGLEPTTTYFYQAIWRDKDGNEGKTDIKSFTTTAASKVENVTKTNITLNSAVISFKTTLNENPINATVNIYYGENTNYGKSLPAASIGDTHKFALVNLTDTTTYHFQIVGTDYNGDPIKSDSYSFDTLTMPKIIGDVAYDQEQEAPTTTYRFRWKTNVATDSTIYYTDNKGKKQSKSSPEFATNHELNVSDLADKSVYSFTVTGLDPHGTSLKYPYTTEITTPKDTRKPKISNLIVEIKSSGFGANQKAQAVVSWNTDEPSTTQVEYEQGISGNEYKNKSKTDIAYSTSHAVILSDLEPSKIYHLRAVSSDPSGNTGYSEDTTTITGKQQDSILDIIITSLQRSLGWIFKIFGE